MRSSWSTTGVETERVSSFSAEFERVRQQVKLIQLPKNQGKGHAVRLGVLKHHGKTILFADADGATPIEEFARLYAVIQSGGEVAIGSRALAKPRQQSSQPRYTADCSDGSLTAG
jgi:glycosyltransferase involved in cell wall biosynthesis